ncbi:MAG: MarR family transcriptional regulator [Thaumarchaeota archaeon]|nr:MarR family transcriptional regulator [Nitrososphaerota archaeon]
MTNAGKPAGKAAPTRSKDYIVTPALLRGARDTYREAIRKNLAEGGFDDVPRNGAFVLGAMVNYGIPSGEVVKGLGVSKQAASQLVDLLVVRGYLDRAPDAEDRRRVTLKPTERGRAAAAAVRVSVDSVDAQLAKQLSAAELATFRKGLIALIKIGADSSTLTAPS